MTPNLKTLECKKKYYIPLISEHYTHEWNVKMLHSTYI